MEGEIKILFAVHESPSPCGTMIAGLKQRQRLHAQLFSSSSSTLSCELRPLFLRGVCGGLRHCRSLLALLGHWSPRRRVLMRGCDETASTSRDAARCVSKSWLRHATWSTRSTVCLRVQNDTTLCVRVQAHCAVTTEEKRKRSDT